MMTENNNGTAIEPAVTDPVVAAALAQGPFHVALRAAIQARGLGLDRLRHHLRARDLNVSTTSLSYWQHGRTQPEHPSSIEAVKALEEILRLPRGSLRSLLGPKRARGPRSLRVKQRRPETVLGAGQPLRELCDQLPLAREHHLNIEMQQVVVTIDENGRDAGHDVTMLVTARRDGVDRYIAMFRGDPGCVIDAVQVTAARDCAIGRITRHHREPVLLAEIVFGTQLAQGESHLFRFEVKDGTSDPATCFGQGFRYPVGHYTLQVRFDPALVPARVFGFAQSRLASVLHETGDLPLTDWLTAQLFRSSVDPGALGIGWEWPRD